MSLPRRLSFLFLLAPAMALAQTAPAHQDLAVLKSVAEQFLQKETAGLQGEVKIEVRALDARMQLAPCAAPEAFQQPGARAFGNVSVGLRCNAPAWKVFVQGKVSVLAEYVAAAVPLAQGQPIDATQLVTLKGDLASLPNGVVTDIAQAVGRSSNVSLAAGAPLRLDGLKSKPVVQQGQMVRVVSNGAGFKVSAEGRAIGNAGEGQVVQVRTPAGAVISGIAQAGGLVEVAF